MLLGWLSVQPRKQTGLIAKTPKGHGMMGLSHTGPMCTGAGVWDLEGHVSQGGGGGGGGRSVTLTGDFCSPELKDHGGGGNRPRGMLQATDCGIALCCTCARSSWSLIPARLGWAETGLRYLVPSLALLLIFMKPSVCGCLSFPPTRSYPSRLDAADPGPPCG